MSLRVCASLALGLLLAAQPAAKKPISVSDFDAWRSLGGARISPDGRWLAYGVFPQEGDGEVIVRAVDGSKEFSKPAGMRPRPEPSEDGESRPVERTVTIQFSDDSRWVVFSTFPTKAAGDQARKEKKPAPTGGLTVVDTQTGTSWSADRVRTFRMPEDTSGLLVYHASATPAPPASGEQKKSATPSRRRGGAAEAAPMTIRQLASGTERVIPDVVDLALTRDGKTLLYAVKETGVYSLALPDASTEPVAITADKGRYSGLAMDENEQQAAFLQESAGAAKVWHWKRGATSATEIAGAKANDKAPLTFSRDGERLFFGITPDRKKAAPASVDGATFDLWHYKDPAVQTIQKARATQERNRTYRGVIHLADRRALNLSDETMAELSPADDGRFAIGTDERAYRPMAEYDKRYSDAYLVDTATGQRTLFSKKHNGSFSWSPNGKFAVWFDGKDWWSVAAPSGKKTNLTAALNVKFLDEDSDVPDEPRSYGNGGWLADGASVLLNDRYDVWRVNADGSGAVNVTDGLGRAEGFQFRAVRLNDDRRERGFDPTKPLLLRAVNLTTRETGFWRDSLSKAVKPEKLVMEAREFGTPIKARKADAMVFTVQRFDQFPDLHVATSSLGARKQVSNVGKQMDAFAWGTSELVSFRSTNGQKLQAALYKPAGFDPSKKYPMIIYIYERLSQRVHTFTDPRPGNNINISQYVSNGYVVLTPDIAYRVGYPGESAMNCVLPAIDAVVEKGFVDEKAIGIQGHSWGGYQIAYMITRTNRFKAASAGAPVANMISAYDGIRWGSGLPRQFQYERGQSRIGGSPWQYPLRFLENSPIFAADRVTTPLLMLHNDGDDAVPWYQGIEYFLALRRIGKAEVYLFNYNGEPHGLRQRANQKDYTRRLQDFFDHHLKGAPKTSWMERGIPYLEKNQTEARTESDNR